MRQRYLGYLLILAAASLWALLGPVSRFSLEAGLSPLEVAFWRALFGGLFFLLHAAKADALRIASAKDGLAFALFGAVSLGGFFASYQYAVKTGGAALASVLLYTAPAWVAVFSRCLFGESVSLMKAAAIGLSLAGVCCVSFSGGAVTTGAALPGVVFGLISGLLYATHYIMTKKYLTRYTAFTLYAYWLLFGALSLLPFISFSAKTAWDWGPLVLLGLVCTYGAYSAYCAGIRLLEPTRAAVVATLEPVLATLVAWWWWGEAFTPAGWAGAVLIIGAVLLMVWGDGRRLRPAARAALALCMLGAASVAPGDVLAAVSASEPGKLTIFGMEGLRIDPEAHPSTRVYAKQWRETYERQTAGGIEGGLMPGPTRQQWENVRKQYPGMDADKRLRTINGFFNSWPGITDERNYGKKEYWASSAEFLNKGGGDCEDYSLAKYFALRELGWPERDMWLVLLKDVTRKSDHAVLAVRLAGRMLILDNLSRPGYLVMPDGTYNRLYVPYMALNADGFWVFPEKGTAEAKAGGESNAETGQAEGSKAGGGKKDKKVKAAR